MCLQLAAPTLSLKKFITLGSWVNIRSDFIFSAHAQQTCKMIWTSLVTACLLIAPSLDSCQMCLWFSMSAISSMVLRNACWGTGDSCVPHLTVGRGLSHLMTPGGWSVTHRSAVGLSSAETAGRPTMRGCVPQHCPRPLLKPHRWVYTTNDERILTDH